MEIKDPEKIISELFVISEEQGEKIFKFKKQILEDDKPNKKRRKQSNSANAK